MKNKTKWYHSNIGIIILLVIFFPVGLYLMWRHTDWHKNVKYGITAFYIILSIFYYVKDVTSPTTPTSKESEVKEEQVTKVTPTPQVENKPEEKPTQLEPTPTQEPTPVDPEPTPELTEKADVQVTSQIVKKVDGKYRYFFDIRNYGDASFEGSVTISLYNELFKSPLGTRTFNTSQPIEPKLGDSVYFDINTGPTSVHGENGINKFKFVTKVGDKTISEGEGEISEKLEDLDW